MCVSFGDSDGEEKSKNLISERDGEGTPHRPLGSVRRCQYPRY